MASFEKSQKQHFNHKQLSIITNLLNIFFKTKRLKYCFCVFKVAITPEIE